MECTVDWYPLSYSGIPGLTRKIVHTRRLCKQGSAQKTWALHYDRMKFPIIRRNLLSQQKISVIEINFLSQEKISVTG